MAASKSLILLNGIAGFAATCLAAAGGFEVNNLLQSSSNSSSLKNDEEEEDEIESREGDEDLGIPTGCFISACELTAEQLRKLKFERRSDSSISFGGLSENDTFELTVEDSKETTKYPGGRKYILKAKTTSQTVTIEGVKGGDIVLGTEGVDLREKQGGRKLEKVPEEVNELGIPKRCEEERTCELTNEQLQRLKFETKDDNTSISVNGLTGKNTVTLTVEDSTDSNDYPKNKKYTLTSKTGTVTIRGVKDGDIVLEKDKGVDFRETSEGSKLETVENSLGIPRRCETSTEQPCQLTKDELQKLKFETEDESSITVEELTDGETVELTIEDKASDLINYPKGKKYTLKSENGEVTIKGVKGGDITLGKEGVVIREKESGGKLEKAPEEVNELGIPKRCTEVSSCQLTKDQLQRFKFEAKGNEDILVEGAEGNIVTLKVEKIDDSINYPKGKKYTLTTTKDRVTIKDVKGGDINITKDKSLGVLIRETDKGGRLEEVIEEIDYLGIPKRCALGACKLTKEQLLRLKFETKNSSPIKIEGLGWGRTVDLTVTDAKSDQTNYPKGKKYTLKSTGGKVTIKGVKGGDIDIEDKVVVIREKRDGGLLERGAEEVNALGIPWGCISKTSCELTKEQLQRLKFEAKGNSQIWVDGMGINDRVTLKVDDPKDKKNYPKERRYSFKANKDGVRINGTKEWDIVLEKDKWVDFREKPSGGQLETLVDSLGIPRSCNANEVKKGSGPQTCQLTEELLKNIKFKNFSGKKADAKVTVTGLYVGTIKLTISWTEDKNYPDNKKYSFDNTDLSSGNIKISKDGERVTIDKQKEYWFKNVNGQLEQVGAKTKSEVKTEETNEILGKLGLGRLELKSSRDFTTSIYSDRHNRRETSFNNVGDLKKIKFKDLDGGAEEVDNLSGGQKITVSLDWDKDTGKYPYNMKITFKNESISPSFCLKNKTKTVEIVKNVPNVFKVENQGDKWYLVKSS